MRSYPLQEYFTYTRTERNAAVMLVLLIFVFHSLPLFYPLILPAKGKIDFSSFQEAIAGFAATNTVSIGDKPDFTKRNEVKPVNIEEFPFDPNNASREDLIRLGISERVAQTIVNYRNKGGRFFRKEDLSKIYGLRPEDYARLEPWVRIKEKTAPDYTHTKAAEKEDYGKQANFKPGDKIDYARTYPAKETTPVIIDINTASPEEWMFLRGIGQGYARRIVNFREKLGGFSSIEQVGETFGLPDSTFQQVKSFLQPSPIFRKIQVNIATMEELKAHPYLSNFQATALFNYRRQHGAFSNMDNLKKIAAFKESDWQRLAPYLSFE